MGGGFPRDLCLGKSASKFVNLVGAFQVLILGNDMLLDFLFRRHPLSFGAIHFMHIPFRETMSCGRRRRKKRETPISRNRTSDLMITLDPTVIRSTN
jgi:hypothetical protein